MASVSDASPDDFDDDLRVNTDLPFEELVRKILTEGDETTDDHDDE